MNNIHPSVSKANDLIQMLLNTFPTFGILLIFFMIGLIFWHTHKIGKLDWSDLITAKNSNNVSLSKCLQLIGGVTGTWMVVYMTLHDKVTFDILLVYLAYVGSVEGFSKFLATKYGSSTTTSTYEHNMYSKSSPKDLPTLDTNGATSIGRCTVDEVTITKLKE